MTLDSKMTTKQPTLSASTSQLENLKRHMEMLKYNSIQKLPVFTMLQALKFWPFSANEHNSQQNNLTRHEKDIHIDIHNKECA